MNLCNPFWTILLCYSPLQSTLGLHTNCAQSSGQEDACSHPIAKRENCSSEQNILRPQTHAIQAMLKNVGEAVLMYKDHMQHNLFLKSSSESNEQHKNINVQFEKRQVVAWKRPPFFLDLKWLNTSNIHIQ